MDTKGQGDEWVCGHDVNPQRIDTKSKKLLFVCIFASMYVRHMCACLKRGKKRVSDALEPEL